MKAPRSFLAAVFGWLLLASAALAAETPASGVRLSADGRTAYTTLDILTYNIEGVPGRRGRSEALAEIGRRLDALRRSGEGPDVILVQEAFTGAARSAVEASGYPFVVRGPGRKQRRELPRLGERRGHRWLRGELGVKLVNSGLAIASVHPLVAHAAEPFSRRACAGFDCLANKGGLFVRLRVPGVPGPVDLVNTHMNAQRASGVGPGRHVPVHQAQAEELAAFIDHHHDPANPLILGGDFNMRGSEARFAAFEASHSLQLVHHYCLENPDVCDIRMSWDGDAPWMDTQDLQLFRRGARIQVRPIRVEALFDGRPESPRLSDHDGLRVVYELSWPVR